MLLLAGCSGDDDSGPEAESVARSRRAGTSVAGDYDTAVELLDSTCDGIEVADNETTVEQDGDSVTLIHAGISYVGPLRDDGSFATAAVRGRRSARTPTRWRSPGPSATTASRRRWWPR